MNKTQTAIAIVIALVVVGGGFYLFGTSVPGAPAEEVTTGPERYENSTYGVAFAHAPDLLAFEREAGTPERRQLSVFLTEDTQENRDVLEGKSVEPREGPRGISVDVYENADRLSASEWVRMDTNWTVATSEAVPVKVNGREGVMFTWSGLYEGRSVVITSGERAYVFSVTTTGGDDRILSDFEQVLQSVSFEE